MTSFARRVHAKRIESGLDLQSLRSAARASHVSTSTISRVEHGHTPNVCTFILLARWLDLPRDLMLSLAEEYAVSPGDPA